MAHPASLTTNTVNATQRSALDHAVELIESVCRVAGSRRLLSETSQEFTRRGLLRAIRNSDTGALFGWLMETFSFQGISDQVAATYMQKHGSVRWTDIAEGLSDGPSCPRLDSYWTFDRCGYEKGSGCCAEPEHVEDCPLPRHRLRNGRLNQTAYSLFLFVRDIAQGDLVGWIDAQLSEARSDPCTAAENLIGPLRHVFGVSDKVLTMSLSTLLMGARDVKPAWFTVGAQMIAVDTLVHNFLHRTGILQRFSAEHAYGPRCYAQGCCADIIRLASAKIDARQFNSRYPADFPRFVQHAVWSFCAADGFDTCNGNMIDDLKPCRNAFCQLFSVCDRVTLKSPNIATNSMS